MKLTCMRGYPGSGKSTIAQTLPGVVVCRDDLRKQLYGSYSVGKDGEEAVTVAERAMVRALLKDGRDVVVDAMHVNPQYLKYWAKVASETGAEFDVHDVPTPAEECEKRDLIRGGDKHVGSSVIRKIAKRFPPERWPTITAPAPIVVDPYIPDLSKPPAIIVDIDGTLAHMTGRSPFDYSKVSDDEVDLTIRRLAHAWDHYTNQSLGDAHIIICSGRDDTCRVDTHQWLCNNRVLFDQLLMRPTEAVDHNGNKLPDWIVKLEIFNKHIRYEYNVHFVLDDRNQVVDMWRKLGLKCLQVAPGDF